MEFELFKNLPDRGKCFHLKNFGTYLSTRKSDEHWINLYAVEGFYAEVVFRLSDNKIMKVKPFSNLIFLEPYLAKINLGEIHSIIENEL